MRRVLLATSLLACAATAGAQRPWQKLESRTVAQVAAQFREPPPEYSATVTWGWDQMNESAIPRDLDILYARGFRAVTIEAGYHMSSDYLSDGWFSLIARAVEEARRRNMRVWIIDEGKYPSGFAGGKFSRERPELRMQGVTIAEKIRVRSGETLSRTLPVNVVSAVALNLHDSTNVGIDVHSGRLQWVAPEGDWEVWLAGHGFHTSQTRAVNNASGGKDTVNSLFDYLNPAATRVFIDFTHEQYHKRLSAEFGRTILGFRGDEPDYGRTPWTPAIVPEFQRRKGYDVRPYLASFFLRRPSEEQNRAKADYWDVWSALFGDNF
ncbi:MAG: glycosyl hydrolase, partial [Gammaproteobacteria bacterium]